MRGLTAQSRRPEGETKARAVGLRERRERRNASLGEATKEEDDREGEGLRGEFVGREMRARGRSAWFLQIVDMSAFRISVEYSVRENEWVSIPKSTKCENEAQVTHSIPPYDPN